MRKCCPGRVILACLVAPAAWAQQGGQAPTDVTRGAAELRAQIAEQQAQIRELQAVLQRASEQQAQQQRTLESMQASLSTLEAKSAPAPAKTEAAVSAPVEAGFGKAKFDGLLQAWYQAGDNDYNDSFRIRRAEMKFTGEITPQINWSVMIDPAKALAVNSTLVTLDGVPVVSNASINQSSRILQDAFITLKLSPHFNLNVGQFKVPLSLEGLQSSAELDTERALFASDRARGGTYGDVRDIGAMLYGPLGYGLEYQFGVFNGSGESQNDLDRNDQKAFAARLVLKPSWAPGLQFGGSGVWGNGEATDQPRRDRLGGEVLYEHGPLTLQGEYMTGKDGSLDRRGYYGHVAYKFSPLWEGFVRFDSWDPDTAAESSVADVTEEDYVAGFSYYMRDHRAKLQFNYLHKTFTDDIADTLNLAVLKLQTWW